MKKSLFSLSLMLFFLSNILLVSFISNVVSIDVKKSSIEQIFFVIQNPINMLSQKVDNKAENNKKEQKNNKTNLEEYILFSNIINISEKTSMSFSKVISYSYISNFINTKIEYPLKIPFCSFIFLLLVLKLLFNILPRSISINYNIKNIEGACVV